MQSVENPSARVINRMPMIKDIPINPDPPYRLLSKPTRILASESHENIDIHAEININFEENSLFQEGVISETSQRSDKSFFQKP